MEKKNNADATTAIKYQFVAIPSNFTFLMDVYCQKLITVLMQKLSYWKNLNKLNKDGYFYMRSEDIAFAMGCSRNTINLTTEALYQAGLINVISSGFVKGKKSCNQYKVNLDKVEELAQIDIQDILDGAVERIEKCKRGTLCTYMNSTEEVTVEEDITPIVEEKEVLVAPADLNEKLDKFHKDFKTLCERLKQSDYSQMDTNYSKAIQWLSQKSCELKLTDEYVDSLVDDLQIAASEGSDYTTDDGLDCMFTTPTIPAEVYNEEEEIEPEPINVVEINAETINETPTEESDKGIELKKKIDELLNLKTQEEVREAYIKLAREVENAKLPSEEHKSLMQQIANNVFKANQAFRGVTVAA